MQYLDWPVSLPRVRRAKRIGYSLAGQAMQYPSEMGSLIIAIGY